MTEKCTATCKDGSPCEAYPLTDEDKCRMHIGTSSDGESHEGNDWAAKAGAWAEDFYEGFLTEAEQERVEKSAEILGEEAGAQAVGQHAASVCLEQFRRTGDERFMRRYESICDTFNLTPTEDLELGVDPDGGVNLTIDFNDVDT